MTAELDEIYTRAWFENDFAELQPEFDIVADSLIRQFKPLRVVDVGCGPGMMARRFRAWGGEWHGLEGSAEGIKYAAESTRAFIFHRDITEVTDLRFMPGRPSLIICTEVAEHLEEKHAAGLVSLLCSAMCPVVFTAAPPGQEGHHHVNCQPKEYWGEMFRARGCAFDVEGTAELRERWGGLKRLSHMRANVMVFR